MESDLARDLIMGQRVTDSFDPFAQNITFLYRDGSSFQIPMGDIDDFYLYSVQICIGYASQLGASMAILLILALLTKPDRRRSPIFIINALSLTLNFIRLVLECLYFTGPFSQPYAYFSGDYSLVPWQSYTMSVAATVLIFLLLVSVEASLMLQAQVVCITLPKVYRRGIFLFSTVIALLAIGFRLGSCIRVSVDTLYGTGFKFDLQWLLSAANITTTISICCFCTVFVSKLGFALHQRARLGLRQWGPMHIIFIMGCQTLIIPAIFSLFPYFVDLPNMDSNVLTLVAIFLPLSSMWASSTIEGRSRASAPKREGNFSGASSGSRATGRKLFGSSTAQTSVRSDGSTIGNMDTDIDLERQGLKDISVRREFGVERG